MLKLVSHRLLAVLVVVLAMLTHLSPAPTSAAPELPQLSVLSGIVASQTTHQAHGHQHGGTEHAHAAAERSSTATSSIQSSSAFSLLRLTTRLPYVLDLGLSRPPRT
jgi:hypothetical protein